MRDFSDLNETYILYEKRYELTKLARECGICESEYEILSSRDKFLFLSYKLKETGRVHLASFFFGKLFELTQDFEALLNKIDCLIILGEFDEAYRFNCIGFELYLEDALIEPASVEKILSYQKAIILFSTEKYELAESICEENIIKYDQKDSFILLCAVFVAVGDTVRAVRVFSKYSMKFTDSHEFLTDVTILLLTVNKKEKCAKFMVKLCDRPDNDTMEITTYLNNFYSTTKNRDILKKFIVDEFPLLKSCVM